MDFKNQETKGSNITRLRTNSKFRFGCSLFKGQYSRDEHWWERWLLSTGGWYHWEDGRLKSQRPSPHPSEVGDFERKVQEMLRGLNAEAGAQQLICPCKASRFLCSANNQGFQVSISKAYPMQLNELCPGKAVWTPPLVQRFKTPRCLLLRTLWSWWLFSSVVRPYLLDILVLCSSRPRVWRISREVG